jgi:hypothetical protein
MRDEHGRFVVTASQNDQAPRLTSPGVAFLTLCPEMTDRDVG